MNTEMKRTIFDHLVLTKAIYLPTEVLDKVCGDFEQKKKEGKGVFQILYELEADNSLNKYKDRSKGAFVCAEQDSGCKAVNQLDLDGSFVALHNSLSDAARAMGDVKKKGRISDAVNGKTKTAYGYKWEVADNVPSLF